METANTEECRHNTWQAHRYRGVNQGTKKSAIGILT
jgi:hypothetical protein